MSFAGTSCARLAAPGWASFSGKPFNEVSSTVFDHRFQRGDALRHDGGGAFLNCFVEVGASMSPTAPTIGRPLRCLPESLDLAMQVLPPPDVLAGMAYTSARRCGSTVNRGWHPKRIDAVRGAPARTRNQLLRIETRPSRQRSVARPPVQPHELKTALGMDLEDEKC